MEKQCVACGATFSKPVSCGRPEWATRKFCSYACKAASQVGAPSKKRGRRYSTGNAQYIPCRICGRPTKYHGTEKNRLWGLVHCDSPSCIEASRLLKNTAIQQSMVAHVKEHGKIGSTTWRDVDNISLEERALTDWFISLGWKAQFQVLTGAHSYKAARQYVLDFAEPEQRLYVEIDGTSHRGIKRKSKDLRKDALMTEKGWRGLRITAESVREDPDQTKAAIVEWISCNRNLCHNR